MQPLTPKKPKHNAEFDEFAANYRTVQDQHLWLAGESSEYYAEYKVRKLLEWLPELQNEPINILDFGCGDGLMTTYLRRYFLYAKIHGADISAQSITLAKKLVKNATFSLIKGKKINLPANNFDLIIVAGVFHHIAKKEHQFWIDQLSALLSNSGKLVIFELNPLNPGTRYIFNGHPMEKNAEMLYPWYAKSLLNKQLECNLLFYCFFPRWFKILRFLEPWLTKIPFGGHYACIAQKKLSAGRIG